MPISHLKLRIYYEDTDADGSVYYANYLKFFERGRAEYLREIKISQSDLVKKNISFVVKKLDIDYMKPIHFDDLLNIKTYIKSYRTTSMIFAQNIYHENGDLLCESSALIVFINLSKKKATAIPPEIIKELNRAL
jgi:acyl-CoA thioester hydrolase